MNTKLTALSIFISALFVIPAAAAATSSNVETSTRHGGADRLILADAHSHQRQTYSNEPDHCEHGKGGNEYQHHSYAHNVGMQFKTLGLTDEQLGKLMRLHLEEDATHERLLQKIREDRKAFRKAATRPVVTDDGALLKLQQSLADSFNEMVTFHVNEQKAVRDILTPEQIGKLKDVEAERDH